MTPDLEAIRQRLLAGNYLFTLHAFRQSEERHITRVEVEEAILSQAAEIIEDYPDDRRGPSCLVLGETRKGRILHVQVSKAPRVWIVTLYEPTSEKWIDPRTRRR